MHFALLLTVIRDSVIFSPNKRESAPQGAFGVPEVIRTPDLPLRRRPLYPAELRKLAK